VSPTERVRCGCGAETDAREAFAFWFLIGTAWMCFDCWYARPHPKRKVA
jgi:hypothetical protein